MQVKIAMPVEATDGHCGEVGDIVIDPVGWRVTHLVVEPRHHHEAARLVPIDAIAACDAHVELSWSLDQVAAAPLVEQSDSIVVRPGDGAGLSHEAALGSAASPYFPQAAEVPGLGGAYGFGPGFGERPDGPRVVTTRIEKVPSGTVEIRRGADVVSSDDHVVGHVDGFVVDGDGGVITHLVLERGHLWGHREVTIPRSAIKSAGWNRIHLAVPRRSVSTYPSVPFHPR